MRPTRLRHRALLTLFVAVTMLLTLPLPSGATAEYPTGPTEIRFATFNASLNRFNAGDLAAELAVPGSAQPAAVAEIIQRTRPDVLLINEFDYDAAGAGMANFQDNYLGVSHNGSEPIDYPYRFAAPSNTGVPSGFDLNNNGTVGGPDDAFGFGFFPGQFGMAIFSMYPIDETAIRTFQTFLWKDMPGALLPVDPATGESWYSAQELGVFRLSSKSHWDVPIITGSRSVHFLVSHPTPPVFDGPEDRNGTRNHDEIRFWSDYVSPGRNGYIYDDAGRSGGLRNGSLFVIAGDQNADPFDGDSIRAAASILLDNRRIQDSRPTSLGGPDATARQNSNNDDHGGDPALDTADFSEAEFGGPGNLRADYVLPSRVLRIVDAGVFWPAEGDPLYRLTGPGFPAVSSDHRLVWVDVRHGTFDPPPAQPEPHSFASPLFGLATSPNGDILVADAGAGITSLRDGIQGSTIPLPGVAAVAPINSRAMWAVSGGADPEADSGQALYRISNGRVKHIANLFTVEATDPDAAGVDSNPYDVASLGGGGALVVDAGGNDLIRVTHRGRSNVLATFPPAVVSTAHLQSLVGCPNPAIPDFAFICNIPFMEAQAVPTSVAIGPDGYYYVGELTGFPAPVGVSSIWRVAPGARGAVCGASPDCVKVFDGGFTSIVDLAFGPDGRLYVAELDEASWAAVEIFQAGDGGSINACDLTTLACEEIATGLPILTAITFGTDGTLWATQNALIPGLADVVKIR